MRSGAKFSMPGMMDTVLNLGLNETTLKGLARLTGDERFALDSYRRFIQLFSKIVLDVPGELFEHALDAAKRKHGAASDAELSPDALRELIETFRGDRQRASTAAQEFPEEPLEQLRAAIGAVFDSWNGKRAVDYRNYNKIPHDLGTAVNVQSMVFGNMGDNSGTGVAFTRDPATGEKALYGEYLTNAQGEDVVAGIRTPKPIAAMAEELPKVYRQFERIAKKLEKHYRDVQDMEFTIERGKLYMLQTRTGKRTAEAAVKIAVEMVKRAADHPRGGGAPGRAGPGRPAAPHPDRPQRQGRGARHRPGGLPGRGLRQGGLRRRPRRGHGQGRREGDHGPDRDQPGRRPRDDRRRGRAHLARRHAPRHAAVVARGMGKPCVAGCRVRPRRPARPAVHRRAGRRSTRARSSPSTAPPAASSPARCRRSSPS